MKQKRISWIIGTIFALPALSVLAQQAAPGAGATAAIAADAPQQITVVGVRESMDNALSVKEDSNEMLEVISSEDIGKLPDTTIAESLARLPGLQSGIDRGNASQVVARGLGPRFIAATIDGRELASPEPNRAVRFEQFPAESLVGANVYKTQSADLIEGGIATTIDLLTVSPLKFADRQITFKADALYSQLGKEIGGAPDTGPRLGTLYVDQFNNHTLGVALAASYQKQPSVEKLIEDWSFNTVAGGTAGSVPGSNGQPVATPWGFQDQAKRGTDTRSSVLAKVEWKPAQDVMITGDVYYESQKILEPEVSHYYQGNIGNWEGTGGNFSNTTIQNGTVTAATVNYTEVNNNDNLWIQNSHTVASGLNGKFKAGDWKMEADLSNSLATRDSAWQSIQQTLTAYPAFTYDLANGPTNYSIASTGTGNPASYGQPGYAEVDVGGHVKDELSALHLNATRTVTNFGDVDKIKIGVRATAREKSYYQLSWSDSNQLAAIPNSDFGTVHVDGLPDFIALNDFNGSLANSYGAGVFSAAGRAQSLSDQIASWDVKENSESVYAQADLMGTMFNKSYRGNVGVRLVHTTHTSSGTQSLNGGSSGTAISVDGSDTEALPSLNLIYMLDPKQEQQVRFSVARALSRAPLDELRASQTLTPGQVGTNQPITGSAGNPALKPMLDDQIDLAYQWYFEKGALLSAGAFFKKLESYIKIENNNTTVGGQAATISESVNGQGGEVRGLELVYQQAFTGLPAPFNGLGVFSNYAYTSSNITESANNQSFPVDGLMKSNGGVTLWYEHNGFEARLAATYHSAFTRDPGWTTGQFYVNNAETNVSFAMSRQITKELQVHFGADNLTDQKLVYVNPTNQYEQQVRDYGRRYNLGISYKM